MLRTVTVEVIHYKDLELRSKILRRAGVELAHSACRAGCQAITPAALLVDRAHTRRHPRGVILLLDVSQDSLKIER